MWILRTCICHATQWATLTSMEKKNRSIVTVSQKMPNKIRFLTCTLITMPPPRANKWARVFAKPRHARHMLSKPSDSDLEDLGESEVDMSLG